MRRVILIASTLVLIVVLAAQPAHSSLFLESSVTKVLSNVYGLELVNLPSWMIYYHYEIPDNKIILGGRGYVASIDLGSLRIEKALAVIGNVTSINLDSSTPSYIAVGSSSGEVLVLNSRDLSLIARFYTATRTPVKSAHIARVSTRLPDMDSYRLIALDERGFLYVMRITRGLISGWFEAGPIPNQGALTGLYGFKVLSVTPLKKLIGWHEYNYSGDRVISITDLKIPDLPASSPFLGSTLVRVYYPDPLRGEIEAYTGVFEPETLGDPLEERQLYFIVSWDSYLLPLPLPRASLLKPIYYGSNATIRLENLPPDEYKLRVLYEVIFRDRETGVVLERRVYMGEILVNITSNRVRYEKLTLAPVNCTDLVENCLIGEDILYTPSMMQGLLILDTTRLPFFFEYERDGRILLLPIPRQLFELGIRDLAEHNIALFIEPSTYPFNWDKLGVKYVAVFGIGEWLAVYYIEEGFKLADVGYEQPQLIYLGSKPTSMIISNNARTILVGTSSGLVFKINWLIGLDAIRPTGGANRYYIDSSLAIGFTQVSSIRMADSTRALVSLDDGRLQLIDVNTWIPQWRGPPGYEGIDTNLRGIVAEVVGQYVVALAPGTNKVYIFRERVESLHPLVINLVTVTYDEEGDWYIFDPPFEIELEIRSRETGAVVAYARTRGLATFYLPIGLYDLVVKAPGATGSARLSVSVGGGLDVRNLLVIYYPGFPLRVDFITPDRTIESIMRFYPAERTIVLRFIDIDENPVREPVNVILSGPRILTGVAVDGVLSLEGVVPGIYEARIETESPLYRDLVITVTVTLTRTTPDTIVLPPASFPVRIILYDVTADAPVDVTHRVFIERIGVGSPKLTYPRSLLISREIRIELPVGVYKIRVEPVTLNVYEKVPETTIEVTEPKTLILNMTRKKFLVELTLKDTWGRPLDGAVVEISGLDTPIHKVSTSGKDGKVRIELPYGNYEIYISKRFYRTMYDVIMLESTMSKEIIVQPGLGAILIRYSPMIAGALLLIAGGIIFMRVRKIIAERLGEEEY